MVVSMSRLLVSAILLSMLAAAAHAAEIEVTSALVKVLQQVEVPAREAGVLTALSAREGQLVDQGALLGQIDDAAIRFEKTKAAIELEAASKLAENDVKVRFARKSAEVAASELRRALDSTERLAESVNASELDQLKLVAEKTRLEIEQAELEFELARTARALKQNDLLTAEHKIAQRQIVAPLAGFVAQVLKHPGEWVEPGQPILRLLRLDRLRAEGLASANQIDGQFVGRPVTLRVKHGDNTSQHTGTIVFVSPEVDPVNGQVRIWAEIDNADLKLRPGLHGSLTIADPEPKP